MFLYQFSPPLQFVIRQGYIHDEEERAEQAKGHIMQV
jgi:hypothetical protein